jgi:prepilin-type N-terminal cleavage/methylation domain-containing protein
MAMINRKKVHKAINKGFTLIELLITIVILGTLSSIAVPGFIAQKNRADVAAANAQGRALMSACKVGIGDGENVATELTSAKDFGNIVWTPVVTQNEDEAPTVCSSTTAKAPEIQQNFALDIATGNLTENTLAE